MASTVMPALTALVLLAALPAIAACTRTEGSAADASDRLPTFGWTPPRLRAPAAERPAWLPLLPTDLPRVPAPGDGFRA